MEDNRGLLVLGVESVISHPVYAALPQTDQPDPGTPLSRRVAAAGFKYLLPPVPEWGEAAAPSKDAGPAGFSALASSLARSLGVDAVITVQHSLEVGPDNITLKGMAVHLWGRDGRVRWSGKIETSKTGMLEQSVSENLKDGATGLDIWRGLEQSYSRMCEYMALKLEKDRR